jgi:hypothetical protein
LIEDKLSRDERIRLEALSQANAYLAAMLGRPRGEKVPGADLVDVAVLVESYIRKGR